MPRRSDRAVRRAEGQIRRGRSLTSKRRRIGAPLMHFRGTFGATFCGGSTPDNQARQASITTILLTIDIQLSIEYHHPEIA